jgi:hypothetical protein
MLRVGGEGGIKKESISNSWFSQGAVYDVHIVKIVLMFISSLLNLLFHFFFKIDHKYYYYY